MRGITVICRNGFWEELNIFFARNFLLYMLVRASIETEILKDCSHKN